MILGTFLSLLCTVLAAYPLSRKEFYGRGVFTFLFAFTMYFSGGLIPTYLLINSLGMLNTRAVMVIPGMVSVWHIILCRTYFKSTIPDELFEAAQIDGCGEFAFLLRVVLPLSAPILAVLGLYAGVGIWNSYFDAMIYLSRESLFPLQIVLRSILLLTQIDLTQVAEAEAVQSLLGLSNLMKYAVIVVASVPVMLIYPFAQRHFVKGVMIGAIKG
jgi:multiple sugar transport system permease protein/putative aldouronate transport system permease protein